MNAFILVCLCSAGFVYSWPTMVAQTAEVVEESYSSSSSSYSSSSSSSSSSSCSSINVAQYQDAFSLACISDAEAQLYLQYLAQLSSTQISYFDQVFGYYSSTSYAMADLVTDYAAFSSAMSSVYQTLSASSIYAANANWATQQAILQQAQANLVSALSYCAPGSCLYNLIECCNTDITLIPLVAGSCYHLANLQNQYYTASSSSTSSSTRSTASTSSTVASSTTATTASTASSSFNAAVYEKAFSAASINSAESQLYLQYLSQLSSTQISYFDQVFGYYSSTSYALADLVTDYTAFSSAISSVYQTLSASSIYAANANWATQQAILQQAQSSLVSALSYCAPGSCLYNLIDYCNKDFTLIPLVAGSCYHLANLQNQYYTVSSSTTSSTQSTASTSSTVASSTSATTASTASSSFNAAVYEKAFSVASINSAESQLYLQYLSQLSSTQISYFDQVFGYYSSTSYAMADLVTDYTAFSSAISSVYQTLSSSSIYAANANWATQQAILQQAQSSLVSALSYCAPGSCLYNLIDYCNKDITLIPLVAGSCYHLANLQNQYYTVSSSATSSTKSTASTSSTVASSTTATTASTASSSFNAAVYEKAFSVASINSAESQLYLQYLSQLSSTQISYFDQVFGYYSSTSYAMADLVTDYAAFSSAMSSVYQTLSASSIYAANANWATQQAILQQAQSSLVSALSYCAPGSCLYNLIECCNKDITLIPLVAGSCYHLANLQSQYYTASSSSSYSSSSGSCSSSSSMSSSSGSAVCVA